MPNKISSISIARFAAMVMIIACHFLSYFGSELAWWFNVGVYVFFVISGFLYGGKNIDNPIKFSVKQFRKILIPYWLFLFLVILLYLIFAPKYLSMGSVIKSIFCVGTIKGLGHLWFIGYILLCYFITPYLYWVRKKLEKCSILHVTVIVIGLLAFIQIIGYLINPDFQAYRINSYIIGYFLAVYQKQFGLKAFKYIGILLGIVGIVSNAIRIYIKYIGNISLSGISLRLFSFFEVYAHLLLGVTLFLVIYFSFSKCRYTNWMQYTDQYSYQVYIVHQLFILSPLTLMAITPVIGINIFITVLAVIVMAVLLQVCSSFLEKVVIGCIKRAAT